MNPQENINTIYNIGLNDTNNLGNIISIIPNRNNKVIETNNIYNNIEVV